MGTPQGSASGSGLPSVVVTTYEMLMGKKDKGRLSRLSWEYIILDEGHRIKNAKCRLNAELKLYKTRHRLLVTGSVRLDPIPVAVYTAPSLPTSLHVFAIQHLTQNPTSGYPG